MGDINGSSLSNFLQEIDVKRVVVDMDTLLKPKSTQSKENEEFGSFETELPREIKISISTPLKEEKKGKKSTKKVNGGSDALNNDGGKAAAVKEAVPRLLMDRNKM